MLDLVANARQVSRYPLIVLSTSSNDLWQTGSQLKRVGISSENVLRGGGPSQGRQCWQSDPIRGPTRHFRLEYFEALESTQRRTCLSGNELCTYVQDTRVTYKSVSCLREFLAMLQSYPPYAPLIGSCSGLHYSHLCLFNTV